MTLLLLLLAALIQVRGQPLAGGTVHGSAELPLERAAGGDTPVLSFSSVRGRLRLLLDTGAASTMVTPELVQRFGMTSTALSPSAFELAGGGSGCGDLRPRRSLLPDLDLIARPGSGRLELRGVEALVLPVAALPPGVDGVLGAPTLRRQPIWIDPPGGRMAFGAAALRLSSRSPAEAQDRTSPPAARIGPWPSASSSGPHQPERLLLRWHQGVPLLKLQTPLASVPALADTGAEGLFISPGLARRLPLLGRGRPLRLVGFCGEQPVEQSAVAGLSLAGHGPPAEGGPWALSEQLTAVIITANPLFAVLGVDAIVGQELLRHRRQLWRLDLDPPHLELD